MRNFQCRMHIIGETTVTGTDGTMSKALTKQTLSPACFANVYYYCKGGGRKAESDYLYIADFIQPEITNKDRELLINIVNQITPCEIITEDGKEYIRFKLLEGSYDKNLHILNYLRYMWADAKASYPMYKYEGSSSRVFFDALAETGDIEDPILRLTTANSKMCEWVYEKIAPVTQHLGHGNYRRGFSPRSTEEFEKFFKGSASNQGF